MRRDHKIDNLRAIANITVVLGHSMILYSANWGLYKTNQSSILCQYMIRFINVYQMPLFFSISGYLYTKFWKNTKVSEYVIHKSKRLIIPFILIALLWMIPIKMAIRYPFYNGMTYPKIFLKFLTGYHLGHLWFLPTLFLVFIISQLYCKIFGNSKHSYIILFIFTFLSCFINNRLPFSTVPYIDFIYRFFWGFTFGALIYQCNLINILKPYSCPITIVTILLCSFSILNGMIHTAIPGAFVILSLYLIIPVKEIRVMRIISENSYGIYLLHSPLIYITFTFIVNASPFIVVAVNFIIFGSLSFFITFFIKKTPFKMIIGA